MPGGPKSRRPGRLQTNDRRLASLDEPAHRPRARRARHWVCGRASAPAATPPGWSITATAESSIERSATPSGSLKQKPSRQRNPRAVRKTNGMAEALNSLFKAECISNPSYDPGAAGRTLPTSRSPSPRTSTGQPPTPPRGEGFCLNAANSSDSSEVSRRSTAGARR